MVVPERNRRDHGPPTVFRLRFPAIVGVGVRVSLVVVVPLGYGRGTSSASRSVYSTGSYISHCPIHVGFLEQPVSVSLLMGRFLAAISTSIVGSGPFFVVLVLLRTLAQRSRQTAPISLGFPHWPREQARVSFFLLQPFYVLVRLHLF